MVSISIRHISKRFGDVPAVVDVSLDIEQGDLFFLLGPSGCGKTTILRMIAGFETPDSGEICFNGRPIHTVPAHKRNTGMVFQNYALWPHMTVAQNVAYGLDERKIPRAEKAARVEKALRGVHMQDYGARMSNQLSGGQQQRVALARALVIEPDAVLLDEPLSNLDARLRLEMRHEIRRIHDETGITMVYVTHDQKESLSMADRLAVMSMGRIEQTGAPRHIYRSPRNRFVADFIGDTNLIPGRLVELDTAYGSVETPLGRFRARRGEEPVAVGENVVCMIRPECLRLNDDAAANRFEGTVRRNVYLGELEEFELDTAWNVVRAVCANPGENALPCRARVAAGFAAEDAVILK